MIKKIAEITFITKSGKEESVDSFQIRIIDMLSSRDTPGESEIQKKLEKRLEHWGYKAISGSGEIRETDANIVILPGAPPEIVYTRRDGTKVTECDPAEFADRLVDELFRQSLPERKSAKDALSLGPPK